MTNPTPPPSPRPRASALHSALRVSSRETQYPWTCPGFVDPGSLHSRAPKGIHPAAEPLEFTLGPSTARSEGLLASHLSPFTSPPPSVYAPQTRPISA